MSRKVRPCLRCDLPRMSTPEERLCGKCREEVRKDLEGGMIGFAKEETRPKYTRSKDE